MGKFNQIEMDKMVEMYNSGLSSYKIAKHFNSYGECIYDYLERDGRVKFRSKAIACRQCEVDDNYFNIIDTHEKAHLLSVKAFLVYLFFYIYLGSIYCRH